MQELKSKVATTVTIYGSYAAVMTTFCQKHSTSWSMLKYKENTLPMAQDIGMSHHVIKEANKAVELASEKQ